LLNVVKELERQRESKIDFVADARSLRVFSDEQNDKKRLVLVPNERGPVSEWISKPNQILDKALPQFGEKVKPSIPAGFLREMAEAWPDHCGDMLTRLMHDTGGRRLVRCLDGKVRAYLSDRYRILDNYDLAFSALDAVKENGGEVFEASLSDTNMRLKFTSRAVWDALDGVRSKGASAGWYAGGLGNQEYLSRVSARSWGDLPGGPGTIHPVVTVSNSETGHGGLYVRIGVLLAACFNIATVEEVAARIHLGDRQEIGIFRAETQELEARTIMAKCQDAIRAAFQPDVFKRIVDRCRVAQAIEVTNPSSAVENFVKTQAVPADRKDDLLRYFVSDYELTVFGFAQAVSRLAQDITDPDDAVTIEELAGEVIRTPALVSRS
jgi:hypothetical protein